MNNTLTGSNLGYLQTGTGSITIPAYGEKHQLSLLIRDDGIDIVHRQEPTLYYTSYPGQSQPTPRISKSIYRIVDGKLKFIEEVEGRYLPPRPEWYEFDREEK